MACTDVQHGGSAKLRMKHVLSLLLVDALLAHVAGVLLLSPCCICCRS